MYHVTIASQHNYKTLVMPVAVVIICFAGSMLPFLLKNNFVQSHILTIHRCQTNKTEVDQIFHSILCRIYFFKNYPMCFVFLEQSE